MSKNDIDLTQELSDDDRLYLESRGLQAQLDLNALHLMGGGSTEEEIPDDEPYKAFVVNDLKTEIDSRNEGRPDEEKLSSSGNRPELVATLVADDEAHQTAS